ncbi:hypothetical protein ACIBG7_43225 [Nonomuraea sp. NPDC050328]|uniref:hypothetical protein n=1 Tax=Nonomuraea sp. NPDC050328 TaxID=3364361 RepID=UPI0037BA6ACC
MPEQVPVRSVRTGGIDYVELPTPEEATIAALRREREGYLRYGKSDRAAQVEVELRRLGASVDPVDPVDPDEHEPAEPPESESEAGGGEQETAVDNEPRERAVPARKGRRTGDGAGHA